VGIPLLVGLFFWIPSPLLILIALIAIPQVWSAFKDRSVLASDYYRAAPSVRIQYTFQYLILAVMLAVMAYEVHEKLGPG
jgi:phosphatidylglycerophosphate synthase